MNQAITLLLVLVALINILPVLGVASAARVESAYSVELASSDLEILLRHRALLFGIVGGFILYAAFVPAYRSVAIVMAAVSMAGFLYLIWTAGDYNPALRRIAQADGVGLVLLAIAALLHVRG
jgi:hypothetical protein